MKNTQQPENTLEHEDNNNTQKISPQDWPPSLKWVQYIFLIISSNAKSDVTQSLIGSAKLAS